MKIDFLYKKGNWGEKTYFLVKVSRTVIESDKFQNKIIDYLNLIDIEREVVFIYQNDKLEKKIRGTDNDLSAHINSILNRDNINAPDWVEKFLPGVIE